MVSYLSSTCDSTPPAIYYDYVNYDCAAYDALVELMKYPKVYPWELEPPILKFIKHYFVCAPKSFNRKLFINAYKSARSTMAKVHR